MDLKNTEAKHKILENNPIFSPLEPPILEKISQEGSISHLEPGEIIITEKGKIREEFYMLIDGELEAFKEDDLGNSYSLNFIKKGEVFGESLLLGEKNRASSVRALTSSDVLIIPNHVIEEFSARYPISVTEFGKVLHKQTVNYLIKLNAKATQLIGLQKNISFFLVNIVVFLSLFAIFVPYIQSIIKVVYPTLITTPLVFIGSVLVFFRLRALKLPLSVVGVTTKNLKKSIIEATVISFSILLIAVFLKFCLIHFTTQYASIPLFLPSYARYEMVNKVPMSSFMFISSLALYAVHAVFQEIIARGSIQGVFAQIFPQHKKYYAIVLASLVFASAHAYFGLTSVMIVFLPGLFWGWMYHRQQNIFGAIVSHVIIGVGTLGFIGWETVPT